MKLHISDFIMGEDVKGKSLWQTQVLNIPDNTKSTSPISDLLARFNVGDIIKAEVQNITIDGILFKMLDGTLFKAAVPEGFETFEGEFIEFVVNDKTGSQIFLSALNVRENEKEAAAEGQSKKIIQLLKSIHIQPEKNNIEIARILDYKNIPIRNDVFNKIKSILTESDDMDIEKAVFIIENNIEPSEKNFDALSMLLDKDYKIGERIDNLLKSIIKTGNNKLIHEIEVFKDFYIKLDSKNPDKDLHIKDIHNDILKKLEVIKSKATSLRMPEREEILKNIDEIRNFIRFTNELGSCHTYLQIPVSMEDKKKTCELYVLRKSKRRRKIDPGNTIILLSLDTNNLGRIDSLIDVNGKNISINFRVKEEKIIGFIKDNRKKLHNSLLSAGYNLVDVKYRLIENEYNILNYEEEIEKEVRRSRKTIDIKV